MNPRRCRVFLFPYARRYFHLVAIVRNLECSASRLFFQTAAFSYVAESSLEALRSIKSCPIYTAAAELFAHCPGHFGRQQIFIWDELMKVLVVSENK